MASAEQEGTEYGCRKSATSFYLSAYPARPATVKNSLTQQHGCRMDTWPELCSEKLVWTCSPQHTATHRSPKVLQWKSKIELPYLYQKEAILCRSGNLPTFPSHSWRPIMSGISVLRATLSGLRTQDRCCRLYIPKLGNGPLNIQNGCSCSLETNCHPVCSSHKIFLT